MIAEQQFVPVCVCVCPSYPCLSVCIGEKYLKVTMNYQLPEKGLIRVAIMQPLPAETGSQQPNDLSISS